MTSPHRLLSPLVAVGVLAPALAGCGVDDALRTQDCPSYDAVRDRSSTDGLRVAPERPTAGGTMTVGRTDDRAVHPTVTFLYGDAGAGCRVYLLSPSGDVPAWRDITDDEAFGALTTVRGRVTAASYQVPEVAEPGTYLLCGLDDGAGEEAPCRLLSVTG